MLALKAIARLIGAALMLAIALVGLGVALYCLDGLVSLGAARPDRLLRLPAVRDHVGSFLDRVGAPGPTAWLALLCGVCAVVIGLLMLLGIFGSGRQRTAVLSDRSEGQLAVSSRALRSMIRALAARADGVTGVNRVWIALRRRRPGGRMRLTVLTNQTSSPDEVRRSVGEAVAAVTGPLRLRTRVRSRPGEPSQRVQ